MGKKSRKKVFFGAMPPNEFAWQMGKTAASISFVRESENYIDKLQKEIDEIGAGTHDIHKNDAKTIGAKKEQISNLRKAIKQVKRGEVELRDWLDPRQFFNGGGEFKKA